VSYIPEVKGLGEERFVGNGCRFATPEEALAYATDLQGRWMGCKAGADNRRATESSDPVNYEWSIIDHRLVPVKPGDVA
jgi:hypothetical protein